MNPKKLYEGIQANYPISTHPNEKGEIDFIRTLRNFGFSDSQYDKLYDELLASCDFFPKVHDLFRCVKKLALERPGTSEALRTKQLLDSQKEAEKDGITFNEWLYGGGYEEIIEDCNGDMQKVRKRLNLMGVTSLPDRPRAKEPQKMEFLTEDLPMFDWPVSSSIDEL